MERTLTISGLIIAGLIGLLLGQGIRLDPTPQAVSGWLTPITALAAIAQAIFAFVALRGLRHARTQAAAATEGLAAMGDTSQRQLRAYLSMTPSAVSNFVVGDQLQVHCIARNHGQTPAYKICHLFRIAILPTQQDGNYLRPPADLEIAHNTTLFPGTMTSYFVHDTPLTAEQFEAIRSGQSALHIWGRTTYVDAFGMHRMTDFSGWTSGPRFVATMAAALAGEPGPGYAWGYGELHGQST